MSPRRRLKFLALLVLFACVGCDQVSKRIATDYLAARPAVQIAGGMVRLVHVENAGGFLGLGSGLPAWMRFSIYIGIVGVGLASLTGYLLLRQPMVARKAVAIALVLGGGLSNWLGRLSRDGTVVDFVQLRLGPLQTGVFNLADMAILGGGLLFFCFGPKKRENEVV